MKQIAYIIEGMYNSGGMERVLSVCANVMCKDFDVTVITLQQKGRAHYFRLDDGVHCHDLGIENIADGKEIKQKLAKYLYEQHFDTVISLGGIDFYYLHCIKDGSRKIVWFHFAFNVSIGAWLGESPSLMRKCRGYIQLARRIYHARKYDKVVAISKSDYISWKRFTNKVVQIPNPVSFKNAGSADLSSKAVISVGRLDIQKGFNYLIKAWSIVGTKYPEWKLDIYGEGYLRKQLQELIDSSNYQQQISLRGTSSDIVSQYLRHSVYVSSSITEAFSLVLLEASTCGLPLVAFDCPSGPRDIIEDGKNGFLIKQVGDIEGMANAISKLIEDDELRHEMGTKAMEMADKFSIEKIQKMWIGLLKEV